MSRQRVLLLATAIALVVGVVTLFVFDVEDPPAPQFSPYANDGTTAAEVEDVGLVPTSEMKRAGTERERRTREKIERSREIERRERLEGDRPDDTLNRIGPTGADADSRRLNDPPDEQLPTGTVDRETIRDGIKAAQPMVKRCYETTLEDFPDARGKVTVSFRIIDEDGEGRVELGELKPDQTTLFDERLHDCMLETIGEARFDTPPEGGGVVNVTYPFVFGDDDDEQSRDDE